VVVDWLIYLHKRLRMAPETLFIAINVMDRFLGLRQVERSRIQLVGVTSMLIASKYQEIDPPHVAEFVYFVGDAYEMAEVLACEAVMFQVLEFNFTFPTCLSFLETYMQAIRVTDLPTEQYSKFLLELSQTDLSLQRFKPSTLALAALSLA